MQPFLLHFPLGKVNEKSGDHNYIETHMFEVLLHVASCNECLRAPKLSNLPLGCNRSSFAVTASRIIKVPVITTLVCMMQLETIN